MAKSYTFTPQASFVLQDNLSEKIIDFSETFTFNSITPDKVQYGHLEINSVITVNTEDLSGTRHHIFVKNESEANIQIEIANGTNPITTLFPGEFIYTMFRNNNDLKIGTLGDNLGTIKYFLIDG